MAFPIVIDPTHASLLLVVNNLVPHADDGDLSGAGEDGDLLFGPE